MAKQNLQIKQATPEHTKNLKHQLFIGGRLMKTYSSHSAANKVLVHQVNIAHYRLIQLTSLAEQERPFYEWVERYAKAQTHSDVTLNEFLMHSDLDAIKKLITTVYFDESSNRPHLFDGAGRFYEHRKASFFFFAWLIRDAPQQRLAPLITKMRKIKGHELKREQAEIDSLSRLFVEYRSNVHLFQWEAVREVFADRLEGSRRSIAGHIVEVNVRAAFVTAIQTYYATYLNYGIFDTAKVSEKQVKIGNDTADIRVDFIKKGTISKSIFVPIKSRETEGGGHAHLFTRDIETAISNIKSADSGSYVIAVIIAENWDAKELNNLNDKVNLIFHFDMNPNQFQLFDSEAQIVLNEFIGGILNGSTQ